MYKILAFALLMIFICSCNRDDIVITSKSKFVVEGWIEEGASAHVIVSRSIPMNATINSSNFLDYIIRSATVSISDGEQEEFLTLRKNENLISSYVYIGSIIKGKAGKKYKLKVEYLNKVLESETEIPKSVKIDKLWKEDASGNDTIKFIKIKFKDNPETKDYYQIMTRLSGIDSIYVPAFYGNISDEHLTSTDVELEVIRGITIFPSTNISTGYNKGDKVSVKLRTMNRECFDFWNSWQNEIINGQNPIFPASISLKGNIKGGLGIWGGYGVNSQYIVIE